jgi:hypothetical protein
MSLMKRRRVEHVSYGPRGGEKQLERGGVGGMMAGKGGVDGDARD